uniref:Variant surface glycoprotein n=1 Tax=Trypanosoma brucei TaxID=5691 RepID=S5FV88_9TRYP|nr:variant surface glycoprotein [Trypanosoma brucei]
MLCKSNQRSRRQTQIAATTEATLSRLFVPAALVGLSLAVIRPATAAADDTGDAVQDKINTACQEAAFAEAVAQTYERIANRQQQEVQDLRKQAANWELAAAAETNHETAALLSALAAHAQAKAEEAAAAIKTSTTDLAAAHRAYLARANFLYGAHEQAAVTWNAESNGYKKATSSTFKARTGAPKPGTSKCDENSRKIGSSIPTATSFGTGQLKKITYTSPEEIAKLTPRTVLTITTGITCATDDLSSWTNSVTGCSGITATPTYTHEAEAQTKPSAIALYANADGNKKCAQDSLDPEESGDTKKKLLYVTCKAEKAAQAKYPKLGDITPDSLSEDNAVITAVRNSHAEFMQIPDTTKDSDIKDLKEYIKKAYGKEADKFKTEFIDNVNKKSISYRGHKATEKAKIGDLALKSEAAAAIAYFQRQKFLAAAAALPAAKPEKSEATKKCKPDTEENECKKDSDCEHKDGKCKLKEGVKSENDGKPTNTTANNSFVISKTPLWLAVLLF